MTMWSREGHPQAGLPVMSVIVVNCVVRDRR